MIKSLGLAPLSVALALSASVATAEQASFERCDQEFRANPAERHSSRCFYKLATATGREAEAYRRLSDLSEGRPDLGWPIFYLALLRWADPESATLLGQATKLLADAHDFEGALLTGSIYQARLFELGRLDEAEKQADRVAELGRASGDPELELRGRIVVTRHLLMVNRDLERAYRELEIVNGQISEETSAGLRHEFLTTFARVALAIGRFGQAQDLFQRLLSSARAAGNGTYEANAWYGLTSIEAGRLAEAPTSEQRAKTLALARRTLEVAEGVAYLEMEAKANWVLGFLGGADRQDHFERCAEIAETERDRSYCLAGLARALSNVDVALARRVVEDGLALAERAGDPWSSAFSWSARMRVLWTAEKLDRAIESAWRSLDSIETLRDLQEDGSGVQAGLFSTWADDYHWFAGRLLEEARQTGRDELLAEAFAVAERLRARALTDWLQVARRDAADAGVLPNASARGSEFVSLAEVQRALGPREALLAFQVAPWKDLAGDFGGGSWVIAVTRRTVHAYPLPGRRELRHAVELYTGLFEQRDGPEAARSASLYGQLLEPVVEHLPPGVDRLILVPDDALHRLPFGALRQTSEAQPLALTFRISVAPSASLWLEWRRRAPEAMLAVHPKGQQGAALILAAPATETASLDVDSGQKAASLAADLPPLVHARREGRLVAAALGRSSELARGTAASESLLSRSDLSRFAVLHLAAHAVTDEARPERSAVVLAPGPSGEGGDDGLLQAAEIAALDLAGKLVVLSSCRSAAGTVLRGEGVMSLARAFFQAGARTVVASLWPVRDDETAELFEAFYHHLTRGETVAAALQAAQADRIAAGAPASAWAAFVVLGDGDLAPVAATGPESPELRLVLLASGAAGATLLLAIAAVVLRRRIAAALAVRRPRRQDLAGLPSETRWPR